MRWLVTIMLVCGSVQAAAASVYVPGQYRDGVYVRPHFVAAPEPALDDKFAIQAEPDQVKDVPRPEPAVIEADPSVEPPADEPAT